MQFKSQLFKVTVTDSVLGPTYVFTGKCDVLRACLLTLVSRSLLAGRSDTVMSSNKLYDNDVIQNHARSLFRRWFQSYFDLHDRDIFLIFKLNPLRLSKPFP